MADFFRVQFGIVSRGDGHCAAKRSAYQACGRAVDHEGHTFDFTRKRREHIRTIMLLPEGAPDWTHEPDSLWQRAAQAEKRIDAQEARIVDFSMPRQVPEGLWEVCIRHVYLPLVELGMVLQIDIHDTPASDGGRNVNVHGLATLRPIQGIDFSKHKDRSWNDLFRERGGRTARDMFAARLTEFCRAHRIPYEGSARPNASRDLPDPEPQLPKWNFEAYARTQEMTEALAALRDHRRVRWQWEAAKAEETEAARELSQLKTRLRTDRQRRVVPVAARQPLSSKRDRRAAVLRAWHRGKWIDADTIPAIASVRFDEVRGLLWIDLADGTTLVDRGDAITMQGRVTWTAALETAAAAERHGWQTVQVHGDLTYKDAVTIACLLRGIQVENHALSSTAQAEFERLLPVKQIRSRKSNERSAGTAGVAMKGPFRSSPVASARSSSRDIHLRVLKHAPSLGSPDEVLSDADSARTLKPRPKRIWQNSNSGHPKTDLQTRD